MDTLAGPVVTGQGEVTSNYNREFLNWIYRLPREVVKKLNI